MIKSVGNGKYKVYSKEGKALSKELSKEAAEKRLKEIEMFKHIKKKLDKIKKG